MDVDVVLDVTDGNVALGEQGLVASLGGVVLELEAPEESVVSEKGEREKSARSPTIGRQGFATHPKTTDPSRP